MTKRRFDNIISSTNVPKDDKMKASCKSSNMINVNPKCEINKLIQILRNKK